MQTTLEKQQDQATFDGVYLRAVFHYDYPQPHAEEFVFEARNPTDPLCRYWASVGGQTFGFAAIYNGDQAALCTIEHALKLQQRIPRNESWYSVHVIWKPKDSTDAAWRRWSKKWSGRTALTPA